MNRIGTFNNPANPTAGTIENPYVETWFAIRGLSGEELDKAQQISQKASHLITVPYQLGIAPGMTFSFSDQGLQRKFQISDIEDPDERHVELRALAWEINQNAGGASAAP